jgi:hypothetical protein
VRLVSLPIFSSMQREEIDHVVAMVRELSCRVHIDHAVSQLDPDHAAFAKLW